MPEHYETAANALLFMERVGLQIGKYNWVELMLTFANLLGYVGNAGNGLSDITAAARILDELESRKLVTCPEQKRKKVLAVIGTVIANSCKVN